MPDEENGLENMSVTSIPRLPFYLLASRFSYFISHAKLTLRKILRDGVECLRDFPSTETLSWTELQKMNSTVHLVVFLSITHSYSTGGNFWQEMTFNRTNDFIQDTWLFTGQTLSWTVDYSQDKGLSSWQVTITGQTTLSRKCDFS